MRNRRIAAMLVTSLGTACTPPTALPAPAAPDRVMPPLPEPNAPSPPGAGRVAIATTDEPAVVEEVTGHVEGMSADGNFVDGTTYRTVCVATPCVSDLGFGAHTLRFTGTADPAHTGTGTVTVGPQPTDYRFALGHNNYAPDFKRGLVTTVFGSLGLMAGFFMVTFAQVSSPASGMSEPMLSKPWTNIGIGTLAVGVAALVLGVHWMGNGGQVQDGTGVQWSPGPP